jgi:hypothetical protein
MNFKNWLLNEMPLAHYGYEFAKGEKKDPPETFYSKQDKFQTYARAPEDWAVGKGEPPKGIDLAITDKFSDKDKLLILHPRTARVLEQKLKSSKYNFNILFIEEERSNFPYYDRRGLLRVRNQEAKSIHERIMDYIKANNLNIQSSITYAANVSTGHIMTPWMILHKLAHAVAAEQDNFDIGFPYDSLFRILPGNSGWRRFRANSDVKNMFSFKSIQQTGELSITNRNSIEELFHELMTEYLWHGKIRLNPSAPPEKKEEYQNAIIKIEALIVKCLDSCLGKVISDIPEPR